MRNRSSNDVTSNEMHAPELREAYLAKAAHRMRASLSPLKVYEQVNELRAHIDALAAAHEELGMSPSKAMESAVKKFGSAEQLGRSIAESSGDTDRSGTRLIRDLPRFTALVGVQSALTVCVSLATDAMYMILHHGVLVILADLKVALVASFLMSVSAWLTPRVSPKVHGFLWTALVYSLLFSTYRAIAGVSAIGAILPFLIVAHGSCAFIVAFSASWFARRLRETSRRAVKG